jgi:hypothetical protein
MFLCGKLDSAVTCDDHLATASRLRAPMERTRVIMVGPTVGLLPDAFFLAVLTC